MPRKHAFIAFEGIDGSGLSTHSNLLREWLASKGHKVILTAEPTDGPIGVLIRQILRGFVSIPKRPDILALLYAADRIYHVHSMPYGTERDESRAGLKNALREGNIVISDRYLLSSLAYQGVAAAGVQVTLEWINRINHPENVSGGNDDAAMPTPDLVIFLDVPPDVSMRRIQTGRQRYELFENFRDLTKVYEKYAEALEIMAGWKVVKVQALTPKGKTRSVSEVQSEIQNKVEEFLLGDARQSLRSRRDAPINALRGQASGILSGTPP